MKKFFRMMVCLMAIVMAGICCFGLAGCKDMKKLQMNVQIYDYGKKEWVDYSLNIELYRHLAPRTVDAMVNNIDSGLYNDALFYSMGNYKDQIMMGDLVFKDNKIEQNAYVPRVEKGEFTNGGVVGSNLSNVKGSIALWRTWLAGDSYSNSNSSTTGRGTWSINTVANTGYDGNFCVWATANLYGSDENTKNLQFLDRLSDAVGNTTTERSQVYVIYYTGDYIYDENITDESAVRNNGLTFNCLKEEDFNNLSQEQLDEIFVAEGDQYACYNQTQIRIPIVDKSAAVWESAVKIKSFQWK